MSFNDDFEYYRERARCERERAQAASDPRAASSHAALAEHYELLVGNKERPTARILTPDFQKRRTTSHDGSRSLDEAKAEG